MFQIFKTYKKQKTLTTSLWYFATFADIQQRGALINVNHLAIGQFKAMIINILKFGTN